MYGSQVAFMFCLKMSVIIKIYILIINIWLNISLNRVKHIFNSSCIYMYMGDTLTYRRQVMYIWIINLAVIGANNNGLSHYLDQYQYSFQQNTVCKFAAISFRLQCVNLIFITEPVSGLILI